MHYDVIFEPFTERHFIKSFVRKYKGAWNTTHKGLLIEFSFFDLLFQKNTAETIVDAKSIKICKTEFKIAGTQESRHSSGNRCIVAVHKDTNQVRVLLVYGKTDLSGSRETDAWKRIVRENYIQYRDLL